MKEFASRTHQDGVPELARDYQPASMDQAAMPVRIEKWRVDGEIPYRVVGIMWGGYAVTDALTIRFGPGGARRCPSTSARSSGPNRTWTLWSHAWRPAGAGSSAIALYDRRSVDPGQAPRCRLLPTDDRHHRDLTVDASLPGGVSEDDGGMSCD